MPMRLLFSSCGENPQAFLPGSSFKGTPAFLRNPLSLALRSLFQHPDPAILREYVLSALK